ncbi:MFS family permease [Actinoalloteichus hoggarensis]|uniref:Multidrug efflux pump Tap n=1 Tax=Actinoalloteichus hoggarensis TaxID=1470176 RepID=A0A221WBJ6_9PSEU|nr:MFS transporter [Actinoalloteichus hoggarensis]ASO23013.1 putative multidrug-efflux transporter [Actinoalloteichus hoggarensis]MBB5922618.1 MFS family permease [Actinoalloteichus hoggarensis]
MKRIVVLFLGADFASLLGNSVIAVALPWLVFQRTGDAAATGTVAAVTAVPALLAAFFGGLLIDRFGRRRMSILADLGSAVSVAALPVVDAVFGLDLGLFILLGVLGALFDVPGLTARDALLPDVASAGRVDLDRLSGLRESLFAVSFLAGPALAGLALTLFPIEAVIWSAAVMPALAALCTSLLPAEIDRVRVPEHGDDAAASDDAAGPAAGRDSLGLLDGLRIVLGSSLLSALTILSIGSVLVMGPLQALVLPVHFAEAGDPDLLGYTVSAMAVGMLGGSAAYAVLASRVSRRAVFLLALASCTGGLAVAAFLPPFWLLALGLLLVGVGSGLLGPLVPVLFAERVPESSRGRVLGVQNAATLAAMPLGVMAAGLLIETGSLRTATAAVVGAWLVVVGYAILAKGMRDLEAPAAKPTPTAEQTPTAEETPMVEASAVEETPALGQALVDDAAGGRG